MLRWQGFTLTGAAVDGFSKEMLGVRLTVTSTLLLLVVIPLTVALAGYQ